MLTRITPKTGNFLISEPFMLDDNFRRSVVLLTAEDEEGHVGYILNQRSGLLVSDLLPECPECDFLVYIGGPVSPDTLHFVHACPDKIGDGTEIRDGLFWSGNFEMLKIHLNNGSIREDEIKFFLGYSGWQQDQLQDELENNAWIVSDKVYNDLVFDHSDLDIWKESIIQLGQKFAHVANFPEYPQWN